MKRRTFLAGSALAIGSGISLPNPSFAAGLSREPRPSLPSLEHRLPVDDVHYQNVKSYIEDDPVPGYQWADGAAYEAFRDMKYGIRIHWGIFSIAGFYRASWPFLSLSYAKRAKYNELFKSWNPKHFDPDAWMSLFAENGARMFAFTTKHHEGFSMFNTATRVHRRISWDAPGGPKIEDCDVAYSIMETPFHRDIVKEVCEAGRKKNLRIALYFSHPDWYDADFRPYAVHPAQVPCSQYLDTQWMTSRKRLGKHIWIAPNPSAEAMKRLVVRHRAQIEELLSNYGNIHMLSLDQYLGPLVWPQLRQTMFRIRQLQPNVMVRARGIGNYGDYYTPEDFIPGNKSNTKMPWMVIYPLARGFSYDPDGSYYKGAKWIVDNIIDTVCKGGGIQIGFGPDADGQFHPEAVKQMKQAGAWLRICGSGIYGTRPRADNLWKEGEAIRFTRTKDNRTIYCFSKVWPGKQLHLHSVKPKPGSVIRMFGYPHGLPWTFDSATGLTITIPEAMMTESHRPTEIAWVWVIQVA